jgi:hypothetical protein
VRTPKDLRAEAARARAAAQRLIDYAQAMDHAAELSARNGYAKVGRVESTVTVTPRAGHRGPDAMVGPVKELATALGLKTLQAVADALGVRAGTARQWNKRKSIPDRYKARIDALTSKQ